MSQLRPPVLAASARAAARSMRPAGRPTPAAAHAHARRRPAPARRRPGLPVPSRVPATARRRPQTAAGLRARCPVPAPAHRSCAGTATAAGTIPHRSTGRARPVRRGARISPGLRHGVRVRIRSRPAHARSATAPAPVRGPAGTRAAHRHRGARCRAPCRGNTTPPATPAAGQRPGGTFPQTRPHARSTPETARIPSTTEPHPAPVRPRCASPAAPDRCARRFAPARRGRDARRDHAASVAAAAQAPARLPAGGNGAGGRRCVRAGSCAGAHRCGLVDACSSMRRAAHRQAIPATTAITP